MKWEFMEEMMIGIVKIEWRECMEEVNGKNF